jgi:lysophospholipase L1-like esterase
MRTIQSITESFRARTRRSVIGAGIGFLLLAPAWGMGQHEALVKTIAFSGRSWQVLERTIAGGDVQLVLAEGGNETVLSAEMGGENYFLQGAETRTGFTLAWLHFHQGASRMAVYRHGRGGGRLLGLNGFRSFPQVEIMVGADGGESLFFLGERDGTVDLFHYDLDLGALTRLTASAWCEKDFSIEAAGDACLIRARTLIGTVVITFDPRSRRVLSHRDLPVKKKMLREKAAATGSAADIYNTYVGFGDSITWGQISGAQHPSECFLNQIKLTLTPDWGELFPLNLGVPGTRTVHGAMRIEQDLEGIAAQYFLLMYGVNDVWRKWGNDPDRFSLASCREDIAFMIDVAKAREMDVIVSTLTPRKDLPFVLQDYYWQNLQDLSDAILELAAQKEVASIDTLSAFLDHEPPDGWKDLLEDPETVIVNREEIQVKGNHPNALGHRLIADLFVSRFKLIHAPQVAIAEAPREAYAGETAHFAARATPYADASLARVEWAFSNESVIKIGDAVDHVMKGDDEVVTVTATAIDGKGRRQAATAQVMVHALLPPTVVITDAPGEAYAGETAHFAARALPFRDAAITRIEWTFSGDERMEAGAAVDHRMKGDNQVVTVTATAIDSKGLRGSAAVRLLVRAIYAPLATWRRIQVRTLFYDRAACEVTWTPDPRNQAFGFQIVRYWVFRVDPQGQSVKIATVEATAPLRIVDLEAFHDSPVVTYNVAAVDAAGHTNPLPDAT